MSKSSVGRFFEDFRLDERLIHATPRTLGEGERALYAALYGGRFALHAANDFAHALGHGQAPLDDLLVFHTVFGKSVPDVSLNAVANLGYAGCVFGAPVYAGQTLHAESRVIGLRENSNRKTGTVYVSTVGRTGDGEEVLHFLRWVMVRKRDPGSPAPEAVVPETPERVEPAQFRLPPLIRPGTYDLAAAGEPHLWEDYAPGERIDHVDGRTVEEAEHQLATRLFDNTARVHFNQHSERNGRFGRRIVYGGHVISTARAISFNGLANAFRIAAVNGGRHTAPIFAGDTIYAWSEVLDSQAIEGRADIGALRLRTVALKDRTAAGFPLEGEDGRLDPAVVLDLDYWVLLPRRNA